MNIYPKRIRYILVSQIHEYIERIIHQRPSDDHPRNARLI